MTPCRRSDFGWFGAGVTPFSTTTLFGLERRCGRIPGCRAVPGASSSGPGLAAVAPMLVGVVPFGLVAGASPVAEGLGGGAAIGFSTIVFAGASQLAAIDVLGDGGGALVAAIAAWTINLRMVLYSRRWRRTWPTSRWPPGSASPYLLTDQAYAVSISRWDGRRRAHQPSASPTTSAPALTLWAQLAGVARSWASIIGSSVPEDVPLEFAVPLVFLVLLIPAHQQPAGGRRRGRGRLRRRHRRRGRGRLALPHRRRGGGHRRRRRRPPEPPHAAAGPTSEPA